MNMNAMLFYEPGVVKYENIKVPHPKAGEVLVKVAVALTCGTDIKTYRRGHPVLIKNTPSGFGHEFSGVIAQAGSGVTDFAKGDRVVAANSSPCMECYYCKLGEYNLCEDIQFLNGAYAEYITIPARIVKHNLHKVPEHVSFEEAAFTEPLANVVHGIERTDIKPGQTVAIIGIGPIGLLMVKVAKLKGAKVIAAGRNPLKLKLAKEFGDADLVVDLSKHEDPVKYIKSLTIEEQGVDIAIEAVGLPEIWEQTFNLTRRGGTVHLFGGCKSGSKISFDTKRIHYDEVKIISVFHHTPKHVKGALDLIASGQIDVKKLITHRMSVSNLEEAITLHNEGKAIKIALKP